PSRSRQAISTEQLQTEKRGRGGKKPAASLAGYAGAGNALRAESGRDAPPRSVPRQLHMGEQLVELGAAVALVGLLDHVAGQVRREQLDELVHVAAQEGAAAEADLGDAVLEQVAGVEDDQVAVELRV